MGGTDFRRFPYHRRSFNGIMPSAAPADPPFAKRGKLPTFSSWILARKNATKSRIQEQFMDYRRFFEDAIDQLHAEKRYRVFANLERIVGRFPRALWRTADSTREFTVW